MAVLAGSLALLTIAILAAWLTSLPSEPSLHSTSPPPEVPVPSLADALRAMRAAPNNTTRTLNYWRSVAAHLRSVPGVQVLSTSPLILLFPDFLSASDTDRLSELHSSERFRLMRRHSREWHFPFCWWKRPGGRGGSGGGTGSGGSSGSSNGSDSGRGSGSDGADHAVPPPVKDAEQWMTELRANGTIRYLDSEVSDLEHVRCIRGLQRYRELTGSLPYSSSLQLAGLGERSTPPHFVDTVRALNAKVESTLGIVSTTDHFKVRHANGSERNRERRLVIQLQMHPFKQLQMFDPPYLLLTSSNHVHSFKCLNSHKVHT